MRRNSETHFNMELLHKHKAEFNPDGVTVCLRCGKPMGQCQCPRLLPDMEPADFPALPAPDGAPITESRKDGWPLCPRCGEDELYSLINWNGQGKRPSLQAYIDDGLRCYYCDWTNNRGRWHAPTQV